MKEMEQGAASGPILRDYLYLDSEKVKSIAGQLDWGIPESESSSEVSSKKRTVGLGKFLEYKPEDSRELVTQRSLLDSLFPHLEVELEGAWLRDISEEFNSGSPNAFESIRRLCPEGPLVRVSSDNYLLDTEYFNSSIVNLSTALNGLQWFMAEAAAQGMRSQSLSEPEIAASIEVMRGAGANSEPPEVGANVEQSLYGFSPEYGFSADFLRALIRTTRGILPPGINLYSFGCQKESPVTLATRLQRERRYFDADPEVVAANFGLDPQPWTIVGTVGHYSNPDPIENVTEGVKAPSVDAQLADELSGKFDRGNLIREVAGLLSKFARLGLLNVAQHPGMTIVPIAVYRTVKAYASE